MYLFKVLHLGPKDLLGLARVLLELVHLGHDRVDRRLVLQLQLAVALDLLLVVGTVLLATRNKTLD